MSKANSNKEKAQESINQKVTEPQPTKVEEPDQIELQKIPLENEKVEELSNLDEIPTEGEESNDVKTTTKASSELRQDEGESKKQPLQEITPKPFQSSILSVKELPSAPQKSNNIISDAFTKLKQSVLGDTGSKLKPSLTPIPSKPLETNAALSKQRRLEKDMSEVLSFLSKKISIEKKESSIPASTAKKEPEKKIPPASMNEILSKLTN
ncbi:MAG: hypothetical protein ACW99L_19295, partial [Promethearchaeota archaeon]